MQLRTVFLWSMIGSLALAALVGIVALLLPRYGPTDEILASAALLGLFSLFALGCATVLGRRQIVPLMWAGIGASGAALCVWLVMIWFDVWRWRGTYNLEEFLIKTGATFTIFAAWASHFGLLFLLRLDRLASRIVWRSTLGAAAALALALTLVFWFEVFEEWTGRLVGVMSILGACGTVVTPILALLEWMRRRGAVESIPVKVRIAVTCPRCQAAQELMTGLTRCRGCGLRITIDVEEPRCICGYLVYRLESDRCPECGRELTESDQWLARQAA